MIVVSPTTPMSISNTVDHKNKSVDEMGEKSTTVKTDMLASRYNTRKSLRKANRKDEFDYVDMVRKPIKRSSIKDKMKSDNDVQRLVEDVKKACTKLKVIGKDFLLIIPDEIEPPVMGSERSLQFAMMNKTFIEQYSTFSTGKRPPQSKGLKSRENASNKKFKFSNMKNVPEDSLTTKSRKDHLVFMRNDSLRKKAKVNLKERDNKSNNCRRSPQKQPDMHYRNTENVQNEGQKGAIDDELEMVGTPPRIRDNLPPVSDIHEAFSDDDVEDATVDASEDVSSEDDDNNNEQPNIKLKLKSKLKGSKELLKKWSDLEYGTAKHVVKQVDIDENKYVAVKDNEELHICQKCGLYFMNAHHLKSHQLRVVNCEKRILNVPQTSLDPLTSAVTIPNDEGKTEDKVTLQELINLQKSVPFECVICNKTFVTKSRLTRHMRTHSDISPYTCGICGTQIKTEEGFGVHLTSHFNRPFDCENCDHKFSSLANLEQHKTKSCLHTRRVIGLDVGKPGLTEDLTCDLCSFQAVDMTALALHKSKHTPTNATACFLCKKTVNKAHMKRHIILMHQESKPFQCEVCDKMYKDRVSLQRHIKIHDNKKYTCKVCDRVFTTKSYLTHHMHTHDDIKKYVCQHCGEAYKKKHYLDNHVRLHTGERPFACNIEGCEKSFRSKSNLNQHKRTHNEVGQFVCDICGRTFKQPGQLIFHRKSHSNEYRWPCTYCPEKFKSCWMYKRHLVQSHSEKKEEIESTTNIRLHKCTICGKLYHDTEDLQRHINNHKGVKPFTCSFCNKGFSCKSNLRTHEHGHKGTYKLKCKICYKTFLHEQNLVSHIERVHQKMHEEASEDDITNITAFSAENEQATFYIEFNDLETQANDLHVLNAEES